MGLGLTSWKGDEGDCVRIIAIGGGADRFCLPSHPQRPVSVIGLSLPPIIAVAAATINMGTRTNNTAFL